MMNNTPDIFKNLTPEEVQLSKELQEIIINEIDKNGGVISFSRYMELALYYPELGYYSNDLFKFGASGDFVTAPLISNIFGFLLAKQIMEIFSFGVEKSILEFGAGNGKLAADILISSGENINKYYILELSANLKNWQLETIKQKVPQYLDKVIWLDTLPETFNGVMIANEVLDAQPCDLIRYADGKIIGVGVGYENNHFVYRDCELSNTTQDICKTLNYDYHDYLTEIHSINQIFMQTIAKTINHGAAIFIDYGAGQQEYYHPQKARGSLRGFFRQQVMDSVLVYPGLIDITASVNFSLIANSAIDAELELIGYTTQGNFLINCGLTELMTQLHSELSNEQYLKISNQVNKLIANNEMGDLFKVIGFSKGINSSNWCGFATNDRTFLL
ncbi:MAG: class I SAM-dependent methyltransferase [Neisseriaceae bacterium]|nr:MAG: class I SAM-dependent methyltransferase [Neisseriaceae bacterium]